MVNMHMKKNIYILYIMDNLNNIPETKEEDEVYDAIAGLLNKAISGTEQPKDESSRKDLNNSANQQSMSIENEIDDIDETLYEDDTMQMGGGILDDVLPGDIGNVVENVAGDVGNAASSGFKQIMGTGFVAFEGLVSLATDPSKATKEQLLLHTKVIVFFVFRMIFEILSLWLFYKIVDSAISENVLGTNYILIYIFLFIVIGFKLIGPIFDKFIGNQIYSSIYISILIVLTLLYLASNLFMRLIGCILLVCLLILFLITFVLPSNVIPECFKFTKTLKDYIDFKYYTKDTLMGILGFIGADKICLIIQIILMCYIFIYRDPERFEQDKDTSMNKFNIQLGPANTNSEDNSDKDASIKKEGGKKKNKRKNK